MEDMHTLGTRKPPISRSFRARRNRAGTIGVILSSSWITAPDTPNVSISEKVARVGHESSHRSEEHHLFST
jgi:hypothetical protein